MMHWWAAVTCSQQIVFRRATPHFASTSGPNSLKSLDGPALLNGMHAHGTKQSLVYWLEFKNDDEFPGPKFGSIAGGSAHKFGLFRLKETGQWIEGSAKNCWNISEAEAVVVARRDQLLAGVALLEALPSGANDTTYLALQEELDPAAPDICGLAWAHKYWSLLFPEKLDDFHNEKLQRHMLLRVLETPPARDGLYVCAGRFVGLAAKLGWSMNHLTTTLNERNGWHVRYRRLGTRLGDGPFNWPAMRDGSYAAIGWEKLGDLSAIAAGENCKEALLPLLKERYPNDAKTSLSREICAFIAGMQEGDVILAADGERVLGVGRVMTGPYRYENTEPTSAPHRRSTKWISTDEWRLPVSEGLRTTCSPIRDDNNIVEIERRLLEGDKAPTPTVTPRRRLAASARRHSWSYSSDLGTQRPSHCLWPAWHREDVLGAADRARCCRDQCFWAAFCRIDRWRARRSGRNGPDSRASTLVHLSPSLRLRGFPRGIPPATKRRKAARI